jgi:hypothetical protein
MDDDTPEGFAPGEAVSAARLAHDRTTAHEGEDVASGLPRWRRAARPSACRLNSMLSASSAMPLVNPRTR